MPAQCSEANQCSAKRIIDKGRCFPINASDVTSDPRRNAIRYRETCSGKIKTDECKALCCGDCPNKGFGHLGLSA